MACLTSAHSLMAMCRKLLRYGIVCRDRHGSHSLEELPPPICPLEPRALSRELFGGPFQGRAKKFKFGSVIESFGNP